MTNDFDDLTRQTRRLTALHHTQYFASVVLAVCVWALMLVAVPALAHVPDLEVGSDRHSVAIGGPEVSRAIYGYLAPGEAHDDYTFTVSEPVTRVVGIIVPAYPEHAEFRPTVTVAGTAGGPTVIEDPGADPRASLWEPFSLASFYEGGEAELGFVPGVDYELTVSAGDTGARSGRYVVVFGGPEAFSADDIVATAGQLPRIWFGAYGGAPLRWNWAALVPLLLGVVTLVALLAWVVTRVTKRVRST